MEHSITRTYVGTTIYMAPERLRGGVYRSIHIPSDRVLAVKCVSLDSYEEQRDSAISELALIKKHVLSHFLQYVGSEIIVDKGEMQGTPLLGILVEPVRTPPPPHNTLHSLALQCSSCEYVTDLLGAYMDSQILYICLEYMDGGAVGQYGRFFFTLFSLSPWQYSFVVGWVQMKP
ncbi:hypothetical protein COOONC_07020 [Cooperia oncophora]